MFDTTVKAYKSINGGNVNATGAELTDTKWYSQQGAATTDKVRRVAQYNSSGTGGYCPIMGGLGENYYISTVP